jgi:hypothetical protein
VSRLTIISAVAWLVAIWLLWFMIRIDDARLLQIGVNEQSTTAIPKPEPEPEVLSCQDTENRLRNSVETARHCTTDDDCTLFDFGYPIDCMTAVAKSEITKLRFGYRKYEEACEYRVYFDCPAEPMQRRAVCRGNRCEVALVRNDGLEEKTLDYLGIGNSTGH